MGGVELGWREREVRGDCGYSQEGHPRFGGGEGDSRCKALRRNEPVWFRNEGEQSGQHGGPEQPLCSAHG